MDPLLANPDIPEELLLEAQMLAQAGMSPEEASELGVLTEPEESPVDMLAEANDALNAASYEAEQAEEAREAQRERQSALRATYGSDFPLASDTEPEESDWVSWTKNLWERHRAGVQEPIYTA